MSDIPRSPTSRADVQAPRSPPAVEIVSEKRVLSKTAPLPSSSSSADDLRSSLPRLELQNLLILIPLNQNGIPAPPSEREQLLVESVQSFLQVERIRRSKDPVAIKRPLRSVLILTANQSAQRCLFLFSSHGELSTIRHGTPQASSDCALDTLLAQNDVVITKPQIALGHARTNKLHLRRVSLLLIDQAEEAGLRSHPCAVLIRDYCRSLPRSRRPRILAIARVNLNRLMLYPIEYNLMSRSIFETSHDVLWSPCYGNSARESHGGLIDIENIKYTVHSEQSSHEMRGQRYEDSMAGVAAANGAMKLGNDELMLLEREIGDLGIALLLKASARRRRRSRRRPGRSSSSRFLATPTTMLGEGDFVGLSEKVFYLIRELQFVYACSTQSHPLSVVIHAGHPIVACALAEVLRSIPMFRALNIQPVLGHVKSDLHQYSSAQKAEGQWQGEETDDEGVAGLAAGVVQILIVADTYLSQGRTQRPLAPTPLVIRFDGSLADPNIDGGGGRCRVIVFRQRRILNEEDRIPHEQGRAQVGAAYARPNGVPNGTANDVIDIPDDDDGNEDSKRRQLEKTGDALALHSREIMHPRKRRRSLGSSQNWGTRQPSSQWTSGERHESKRGSDLDKTTTFTCRPAAALLGPDLHTANSCYQYSVVLYNDMPSADSPSSPAEARCSGIEDFMFLFSQKLSQDELLVCLKDSFFGIGSTISATGCAKLFYHGQVNLSHRQIALGREYGKVLFPFLMHSVQKSNFVWEEDLGSKTSLERGRGRKFCRMYLILPVNTTEASSPRKQCNETRNEHVETCDNEKRGENSMRRAGKEVLRKYFRSDDQGLVHEDHDLKREREIDWENVRKVIELQDEEVREIEGRKCDSLSSDRLKELEGAILYSSMSSEFFILSGKLQENISPLCEVTRSRKFPLRDDGTIIPHDDLRHLVNVHITDKTMAKQAEAAKQNLSQEDETTELIDLTTDAPPKAESPTSNEKLSPVKWCMNKNFFVPKERENPRKRRRVRSSFSGLKQFDAERNVRKQRKFWIGDVRYSLETYMKKYFPQGLKDLTQPLLMGVRPKARTLMDLCDLVQGVSQLQLCERSVANSRDTRYLVPELCRKHPTSHGFLFVPAVALLLEHHLAVCELRDLLFKKTGMRCDLGLLTKSVTSTGVSQIANYERLEFLGDALLKLSSTVRVFTRFPHDPEGKMHTKRKHLVCNLRLFNIGKDVGLQNYYRNKKTEVDEWKPPGTDIGGRAQLITVKGLADVVEALCGAFFLHGATSVSEETFQNQAFDLDKDGDSSDWIIDLCNISDDDDDLKDQKELAENKRIPGEAKEEPVLVSQEVETKSKEPNVNHPFSSVSVERGYVSGYKLLEAFRVFDDVEPSHSEMLLAAAHAMHAEGTPAPTEISPAAFPYDERIATPLTPWEDHFGIIEKNIGYIFKRRPLLVCALTHSSYHQHKRHAELETFQRLEFLGDAIADFFVVRYLYEMYPELDPGKLTDLKSNVVSNEAFARTSITLGLHNFLYMSSDKLARDVQEFAATVDQDLTQEDELGGHGAFKRNLGELAAPKILGDVFEAILGAVYVDSGLRHAWKVCMNLLRDSLRINADPSREDLHPVIELNDLVMKEWKLGCIPRYEAIKGGRRSARYSIVSVYILEEKIAIGKGSKWKRAKLQAAVKALKRLRAGEGNSNSDGAMLRKRLQKRSMNHRVRANRERNAYDSR
ncbi:Ribonuclease III [Gracilaria domingensis]|nr:Ribonuclease III [Gracilaria domingensis]